MNRIELAVLSSGLILGCLSMNAPGADTKAKVQAAIAARAVRSHRGVTDFLNRNLPLQNRLDAAARVGRPSQEDAQKLLAVARDPEAADELRAAALPLVGRTLEADAADLARLILLDKTGGPKLRASCVNYIAQQLEFGHTGLRGSKEDYLDALRGTLSSQENPEVRSAAIAYLAPRNDDAAVKVLKGAIDADKSALIDQVTAIRYAGLGDARLYVNELAKVLDKGGPHAQVAVTHALASFPQYQEKIRAAINNDKVAIEIRAASLQALVPYMPKVIEDASKIISNAKETNAFRADCVRVLGSARQTYGKEFDKISPVKSSVLDDKVRLLVKEKDKLLQDAGEHYLKSSSANL